MRTEPVHVKPSFYGYNSILKTLYKQGKLPEVKFGFYGDKLTKDNCSVEHLRCKCEGGTTAQSNVVLASKRMNNARGNRPLREVFNFKAAMTYIEQFFGIRRKGFNGDLYAKSVLRTIFELI